MKKKRILREFWRDLIGLVIFLLKLIPGKTKKKKKMKSN
jgi:hypothetical protein